MALPDLQNFASALIVKPSSLGDIVHTLPAVHAIKAAHPHLKLRWIAKPEWLPLIEGSPDVDEAVPFPQKDFRGLRGAAKALRWGVQWNTARREVPEVVLDFQGLLRSGMISAARGSRPILGLSDAREGALRFYDQVIPVDANAHAVDRYLAMVRALGIEPASVEFPLPDGSPVEQALPEDFVLVHPYSRGSGKSLGSNELQVLCECLSTMPVVVVGVSAEAPAVRGAHVTDLTNQTTLLQLIWLMRRAKQIISVDSGPMHIGAAVNEHTLGIHIWSDPRKVGPYGAKARVWKSGRIAHRTELTAEECESDHSFTEGDARRLADYLLKGG
jgi:ADP-heptose:LPS heptosyltransferase